MKTAEEAHWEAAYECINIKENEKIVLESKDPHYCYWFAIYVPGTNIKELEEAILESKNTEYCYRFARDVIEANKEALFKVILEYEDKDCINSIFRICKF